MSPHNSTGDFEDTLAARREQLEQLRAWEHELEALKEVEADLEVEKIGAEVALQSTTAKSDFGIGLDQAAPIAEALARKRALERAMLPSDDGDSGGETSRSEAERLRAGIEALNAWLDAAAAAAGWRRPKLAYAFIAAACLATIGAAIKVHLMLLVLLVPLVMALGYLAFTERDADWVRLGATRRFGQTRLSPPSAWEAPAVKSRLRELESELSECEARLAAVEEADDPDEDGADAEQASEMMLAMKLVEASDQLDAELRNANIDPHSVDDDLLQWLQQIHDVRRIEGELSETRKKRTSLNRDAEDTRDTIFRFLALNDAAPAGGRADVDSLDEGLKRLEERSRT